MSITRILSVLTLATICGAVSLAQDQAQPPQPAPQSRPAPGTAPGRQDQPARQWSIRMMGALQPGAIFATDKNVYVLRGETLYQFRASDLELVKKVTIPSSFPPQPIDVGEVGGGSGPAQPGKPRPDQP